MLSDSALFWANQAARYALALSSDARCASIPLRAAPLALSLRDAAIALVTPDGAASSSPLRAVLSTAHGDLFVLTLRTDGRGVCAIDSCASPQRSRLNDMRLGDARGSTFIFLGPAADLVSPTGSPRRGRWQARRRTRPSAAARLVRTKGGGTATTLEEDARRTAHSSAPLAVARRPTPRQAAAGGGVKKRHCCCAILSSRRRQSPTFASPQPGTAATGADDDAADSGAAALTRSVADAVAPGRHGGGGSPSLTSKSSRAKRCTRWPAPPPTARCCRCRRRAVAPPRRVATKAPSPSEISAKSGLERRAHAALCPLLGGAFAAQVTAASCASSALTRCRAAVSARATPPAGRTTHARARPIRWPRAPRRWDAVAAAH